MANKNPKRHDNVDEPSDVLPVDEPTELQVDFAAEPAPAANPTADASPPSAAAPVSESTAKLSHKLHMYGAIIRTSFCHNRATLTFNAGEEREFASQPGVEPTAFAQARDAAKAAYVAARAPNHKTPREEST